MKIKFKTYYITFIKSKILENIKYIVLFIRLIKLIQ